MTRVQQVLMAALRDAVHGNTLEDPGLDGERWSSLLRLADEQEILPLIVDCVYSCPSFRNLREEDRKGCSERAVQIAIRQAVQTNEFLTLMLHAQAQGLEPIVLKGIVVRSLYPKPILRPSVDEDLLIPPEASADFHRFFLLEGLTPDEPEADVEASDELSYHKHDSPTYIELHKSPFAKSDAYGDCNSLFAGAEERTVRLTFDDVTLRTLEPTGHLLYLICHAYKHFLYSGVGVRQGCDMGLFIESYGSEIDWPRIVRDCALIRIDRFAAALFRVAERHLGFSLPEAFSGYDVDEGPLLEDMLADGMYGTADEDRLHSASITLDAVAAQRQRRGAKGILASLFPPVSSLAGRYPYLRKRPWLLPAAWLQRIAGYLTNHRTNASASVQIGQQRIRLLRNYGIID